MGAFQLPDSVLGDAAGCLVYSFLCLIANILLVWLVWTHNELKSYTAFIAYFTLLATSSSIVQQFYDYIFWRDLMIQQYNYGKEHSENAEAQFQKGIFGVKLVLSYIRIFAFTVESTLVFFFSLSVAASVYGWWARKGRFLRMLSITGRTLPVVLALLSIGVLQTEIVQRDFFRYLFIANLQFLLSLAGACILLLMVLFKYMQARSQLKTWGGISYGAEGVSTNMSSGFNNTGTTFRAKHSQGRQAHGSFDNWLVIRLSIAFVMLCVFEYYSVAPRIKARGHVVESAIRSEPDLSEKRALASVRGYLAGVSPSLLAFVVFGTTKAFQQKMYTAFVPRFLRKDRGMDFISPLPLSHEINRVTHSSVRLTSFDNTRQGSLSTYPHGGPSSSVRRPDATICLSPAHDGSGVSRDSDDDSSHTRLSQIGMARGELPKTQDHYSVLGRGSNAIHPGLHGQHLRSSSSPAHNNRPMPVVGVFDKPRGLSVSHLNVPQRSHSRLGVTAYDSSPSAPPSSSPTGITRDEGKPLPLLPTYTGHGSSHRALDATNELYRLYRG